MNQPLPYPRDERLWASFCHLSALLGIVVPVVGQIGGPLIFWVIKKRESAFINHQGLESLNFQVTILRIS